MVLDSVTSAPQCIRQLRPRVYLKEGTYVIPLYMLCILYHIHTYTCIHKYVYTHTYTHTHTHTYTHTYICTYTHTHTHTHTCIHTLQVGHKAVSTQRSATRARKHQCLGFGVQGSRFRVWCLVFGVWGLGFRQSNATRARKHQCLGFRVQGSRFRVSGFGFRVSGLGLGFRV